MRQKVNTYNFLRGGCSFCYWDIFSGLSNENLGTAPYSCITPASIAFRIKYKFMKPSATTSINALEYYQPLLERYAKSSISDKAVSKKITGQVLNDHHDLDAQAPSFRLSRILLTDMRNRLFYYEQSKIFDRSPVKVVLRKSEYPKSLFL